MISESSVLHFFYHPPFFLYIHIFLFVSSRLGLTVLWDVSFFWDQVAMPANPLTSSSILDIARRDGHCSWDVPNLIHCTWIVSIFFRIVRHMTSRVVILFLFIILVFGRGSNMIKQKKYFTKHGVHDFVPPLLKINQFGVHNFVLP
jgi:hypothetical protein